jgi:hypothetical protein
MVETTKTKPVHTGPITKAGIPMAKPPVTKPTSLVTRHVIPVKEDPSISPNSPIQLINKATLAAALNKTHARTLPIPKGLTRFNTVDLKTTQNFFHYLLYAETSMRKTTMAALLGEPEETMLVMTRRKEQLIPLQSFGIEAQLVTDAASLRFALTYPDRLWEEARPERERRGLKPLGTLKNIVLDDATEGVEMLLEDADVENDKFGRSYKQAGRDLRELCRVVMKRPVNFGIIALAKVRENPVTHEETIGPDIPPAMLAMLNTEVEFAFYIKPGTHQLLTDRDFITFLDKDERGKPKTVRRVIFAKSKFDLAVLRKNKGVSPLLKYEEGNLQKLWAKIQSVRA